MHLEPIVVRRHGSKGPLLVVLHGGPGATGSALRLAQALCGNFQVLEPLQRRSGQVPLSVARHVEDLAGVAPSRCSIVGWSWGAMLGLSFAAQYPARVEKLVLVGCGTYDERSRASYQRSLQERLGVAERRELSRLRERMANQLDPGERNRLFQELGTLFERAETYEALEERAPCTSDPFADADGHLETWQDELRLQRDDREPRAFSSITAPVLMVHGDFDPHPGLETYDVLRTFIPRIEYVELDRCGHAPWRERHAREPFLALLRQWLTQTRGAT